MSTLRADNIQNLDGKNKDVGSLIDKLTIVDRINFASDAEFNAAKSGLVSVDALKRTRVTSIIAGTEEVSGATNRDAMIVGRTVTGNTDCHAFADRTIMDAVTDAGTYGVFDATTKLRGNNNQNHLFAFQHRCRYEGTNALQNFAGFLSRPEHAGTGVIAKSYGADIGAIAITGGGTVTEQIGVYVRDQVGATANVGINLEQSTGYAYFASGGGMIYNKGRVGFGIQANSNYAASFAGPAVGARRGFIETTAANFQIGAEGDGVTQVISNAGTRLQIKASANGYSVTPGSDNAQTCGDASNRWSVVWAGTGTISTSDAREKTPVRGLTPAEIAAASDLAKEIGAYKFLAALAEKGDAAREHIGMTVQRAIEIMESHGLDPYGYSFICHDEWEQQTIEHPAEVVEHPAVYRVSLILDGNSAPIKELVSEAYIEVVKDAWTEVVCDAGDRYSFRESGLYAFIAAGFEARLSALESK